CGLGTSCSITSGAPTVARGTLVRREIFELALYTFKYVGGIKHVIAFMPPPSGQSAQYLVYLQKSDLAPYLKAPLAQTLGSHVPFRRRSRPARFTPSTRPRSRRSTSSASRKRRPAI